MKRNGLVLLLLLSGLALGAEAWTAPETALATVVAPAGEAAAVKDGNALLNGLLTLFDNLPPSEKKVSDKGEKVTVGGLAEVGTRLSGLSQEARAALEAGVIDKIFHRRYQRMLTIYKLVITPVIRGELWRELFMRAFEEFVWDTTCERWTWEDKDSIAKMAAAMEEEFVQMKIYLDTRQKREELKLKIGKRMLPPPPPPPGAKKNLEEKKPE